jgi:hypothetical protein
MGINGTIVDGRLHLKAKEKQSATGVQRKIDAHYSKDLSRKPFKAVSILSHFQDRKEAHTPQTQRWNQGFGQRNDQIK